MGQTHGHFIGSELSFRVPFAAIICLINSFSFLRGLEASSALLSKSIHSTANSKGPEPPIHSVLPHNDKGLSEGAAAPYLVWKMEKKLQDEELKNDRKRQTNNCNQAHLTLKTSTSKSGECFPDYFGEE